MAGIKQIGLSLLMVGVFVFAMLNFGVNLATDNNANQSISDNPSVGNFIGNLSTNLDSYDEQVNASQESFSRSKPTVGGESLQIESVASIWSTLLTIPFTLFNLTLGFILTNIFGGSGGGFAFVFTIILAAVSAVILLYAWKWIRSGDSG